MVKYKDEEIILSNNLYVDSRILIEDQKEIENFNFKRKITYKCDICNENFITGNTIKQNYRKICRKHRFYYTCDYCGKKFEITRLSDFIGSEKNERFCSNNCALQYRNKSKEMIEATKIRNTVRAEINIKKEQTCEKCGNKFNSIFNMNICNGCITSNTNKNNFKLDQICKKCNKIFHSTFIMDTGPCCNENLNQNSFKIIDNELYYLDKVKNNYVPWREYKEEFLKQNLNIRNLNCIPEGFKLYLTFRLQDSENWSGSRQAFEQNLIDNNISWFVYIKFYINNENNEIKPLVIGKFGSLLVNSTGSDLNFSENVEDGPARRFLKESNGQFQWYKEQIAILKCNTSQEAYCLEKKYLKIFNCFGS